MKRVDFSTAKNIGELENEYEVQTSAVPIKELAVEAETAINSALVGSMRDVLAIYDNKGLMALAAKHLKRTKLADFESWLTRILRNDAAQLGKVIRANLPSIKPQ